MLCFPVGCSPERVSSTARTTSVFSPSRLTNSVMSKPKRCVSAAVVARQTSVHPDRGLIVDGAEMK